MNIIIDDREKYIIDLLKKYNNINYKIERINIGDIAICHNDKIIAIVERKTWNDLASSMRDGRKENVNKLISLRDKINCKIFYFIEGSLDPNSKARYNRIPYKNLRAHLDHLILRDDIHIIHIKNGEALINRLIVLMDNYLTLFNKRSYYNKNLLENKHINKEYKNNYPLIQ